MLPTRRCQLAGRPEPCAGAWGGRAAGAEVMGLMDEAAPTRRSSEGAGTGREWVRRAGHQRALAIATGRLLEVARTVGDPREGPMASRDGQTMVRQPYAIQPAPPNRSAPVHPGLGRPGMGNQAAQRLLRDAVMHAGRTGTPVPTRGGAGARAAFSAPVRPSESARSQARHRIGVTVARARRDLQRERAGGAPATSEECSACRTVPRSGRHIALTVN